MANEQLKRAFDGTTLTPDQAERVAAVREAYKVLADALVTNCPTGRAQSLAIINLEQSAMWAVKAIAHEA